MTFQNPRDEFAVRYYLWAKEEFRLEIGQDFSLLRRIPAVAAMTCLKLMDRMSASERHFFGATMVKRFHEGSRLLGESTSTTSLGDNDEEQEIVKLYRATLMATARDAISAREYKNAPPRVKSSKLKGRLKVVLGPILGEAEPAQRESPVWYYSTKIYGLTVRTCIDATAGDYSIHYYHSIGTFNTPTHVALYEHISILSWLGLISSTSLDPISESQLEPTVQVLADACQRFLDVAPKLLKGLEVEGKAASHA